MRDTNPYSPPVAAVGGASDGDERSTRSLRVIAFFFGSYVAFGLYWTLLLAPEIGTVGATVVAAWTAAGLWFRRPWSQYLVYFSSVVLTILALWIAWELWQDWTSYSVAILLIPGVMLVFSIAASAYVYDAFCQKIPL